jgi:hypothetical protein
MDIVPGFIVGLWFLPMMLNIVLPLVMLSCWLVIQAPSKLGIGVKKQSTTTEPIREKRIGKRVNAADIRVNVSDGVDQLTGLACNVSKMGICIMGLPEKVFNQAEQLAVVMEHKGEQFALEVSPRWEKIKESSKRIGARIESAPVGWLEFVELRAK